MVHLVYYQVKQGYSVPNILAIPLQMNFEHSSVFNTCSNNFICKHIERDITQV